MSNCVFQIPKSESTIFVTAPASAENPQEDLQDFCEVSRILHVKVDDVEWL